MSLSVDETDVCLLYVISRTRLFHHFTFCIRISAYLFARCAFYVLFPEHGGTAMVRRHQ